MSDTQAAPVSAEPAPVSAEPAPAPAPTLVERLAAAEDTLERVVRHIFGDNG